MSKRKVLSDTPEQSEPTGDLIFIIGGSILTVLLLMYLSQIVF